MVTVSIIIVNYRTPELIVECIKTIKQFTTQVTYEVIVVDNASKGDDEGYIKSFFPETVWLSMNYNAGFARANNAGMRIVKGKYLLLLNSDTKLYEPVIDICARKTRRSP
ncbi:MAG: glycosyltransferase [Emticicia sp.]|nr:glycosyltransferase [Emticicia sp.]